MAMKTTIEWTDMTDMTWNPVLGSRILAPAARTATRIGWRNDYMLWGGRQDTGTISPLLYRQMNLIKHYGEVSRGKSSLIR